MIQQAARRTDCCEVADTCRLIRAPEGGIACAICPTGYIANIAAPTFGQGEGGRACNATASYSIVRDHCLGEPSCAVTASTDLFGDPVSRKRRNCPDDTYSSPTSMVKDTSTSRAAVPGRGQVPGVCLHLFQQLIKSSVAGVERDQGFCGWSTRCIFPEQRRERR